MNDAELHAANVAAEHGPLLQAITADVKNSLQSAASDPGIALEGAAFSMLLPFIQPLAQQLLVAALAKGATLGKTFVADNRDKIRKAVGDAAYQAIVTISGGLTSTS